MMQIFFYFWLNPYGTVSDIFTFWIIKDSPAGHYDSFKNAVPFYASWKGCKPVRMCEIVVFFSIHLPDGFNFSWVRQTKKWKRCD